MWLPWLAATLWPLVPLTAFGIGYNFGVDEHHQPPQSSGQPSGPLLGQAPEGVSNRDVSAPESQVILQINHTALRSQDLQRLHGLQMKVQDDGSEALFTVPGDFSVDGNVTGVHDTPSDGLKQGGLSFNIPGLDEPIEGWWAAIPSFDEDTREDVKEAFETIYEALESEQPLGMDEDEAEDAAERMGLKQLITAVMEHLVKGASFVPGA